MHIYTHSSFWNIKLYVQAKNNNLVFQAQICFLKELSLFAVIKTFVEKGELSNFTLPPPPKKKMLPVSVWKYKTYSEVVPEKLNFVLK